MVNGFGKRRIALLAGSIIIGLTKAIMTVPGGTCRYHPSCSEYAFEALQKFPTQKAVSKILYRIIRCNPFSKGGYDPVQ
ncbi:MAG: membrane protein insertion efficiency factor YidD [Chitinivibrionales bacterium]